MERQSAQEEGVEWDRLKRVGLKEEMAAGGGIWAMGDMEVRRRELSEKAFDLSETGGEGLG